MGTWAAAVQPGDAGASWGAHRVSDADGAGQPGGALGLPQAQQVRAGRQISQSRLPGCTIPTLCEAARLYGVGLCQSFEALSCTGASCGVPGTLRPTMSLGCTTSSLALQAMAPLRPPVA